jgi:hypothetical protein
VIFSSNVLEHVGNLKEISSEFQRLLKPNGIAIHVLPTPCWRFWTFLTGFAASLKWLGKLPAHIINPPDGQKRWSTMLRDLRHIASGLIPRAHGTGREGISELWTFSRSAWHRKFQSHGFRVVDDRTIPLFYSGTMLFGAGLALEKRRSLSRVLGSATRIYRVVSSNDGDGDGPH